MQFMVVLILVVPFLLVAGFSSTILGTEEKPAIMAFRDTVPALLASCIFIAPYFGGANDLPYYFSAASITFVLAWLYYRGQSATRPAMTSIEIHEKITVAMIWAAILAFLTAAGGGLYYVFHWLKYGRAADATMMSLFGPLKTGWLGVDRIILMFLDLQWPIGALLLFACLAMLGFWFDDQKPVVATSE